jgi:hypothetical protein
MGHRQDLDKAKTLSGQRNAVTTEEWERAKELFSAAVALEEVPREAFLQSQTDPAETLDEVRSLLAAYNDSPDFLDEAASGLLVEASLSARSSPEKRILLKLDALLHPGPGDDSIPQLSIGLNPARNDASYPDAFDHGAVPDLIGPYRLVRQYTSSSRCTLSPF